MHLNRFFLDEQVLECQTQDVFELRLSEPDLKHARVLRLRTGEHIAIIDATGNYFECEIVSFLPQSAMCVRISKHSDEKDVTVEPHVSVSLAYGLAKGQKIDEVIRHATEVGVSEFLLLKCARSVMKINEPQAQKKLLRWNNIAKSAAMQSAQARVPRVFPPVDIEQFCDFVNCFDCVCICWEQADGSLGFREALFDVKKKAQAHTSTAPQKIAVVVGPEGGFEQTEIDAMLACNKNAHLVSLGSSILRTETAGVLAPALAMYELGMLGGSN